MLQDMVTTKQWQNWAPDKKVELGAVSCLTVFVCEGVYVYIGVLEIQLRASCVLGWHSTTEPHTPKLFFTFYFEMRSC